jgi:hypothetical protein
MRPQRTTMANMGRVCISDPEHGPSLMLDKREWCPDHAHDGNATTKPTPSFLDKQEAPTDGLTVGPDAA